MKSLEMIPLVLYGFVYFFYDKLATQFTFLPEQAFFGALIVLLSATAVVLVIQKVKTGTVSKMNLISAGILLALGLPAIIFQNDMLFKLKPSIAFILFGLGFLASWFIFRISLSEKIWVAIMKQSEMRITTTPMFWFKMDISYILFNVFLAALNYYVAVGFEEAVWVKFKLFGLAPLTMIFMGIQMYYVFRQSEELPKEKQSNDHNKQK